MDVEEAKRVLGLDENFTETDIQLAYIQNVRSQKDDEDFESILKQLNIARDSLTENVSFSMALVPVIAKELNLVNREQKKLALRQEAKEDFSDSVVVVEKRVVGRIRQSRDAAGLLGAASAGLAFFRENIGDIMGTDPLSPFMSRYLLIASAVFGVLAFISHLHSKNVQNQLANLKKTLTRQRTIDRILDKIFAESDSLSETAFERALRSAITQTMGIRLRESKSLGTPLERTLDVYAAIGFPILPSLMLSIDFVEDYIDFLIRSDHVATHGKSGRNLLITRKKN